MKITRNISVDDEVWAMLEELAQNEHTTRSEMIRRLIINEFRKQGETKTEK